MLVGVFQGCLTNVAFLSTTVGVADMRVAENRLGCQWEEQTLQRGCVHALHLRSLHFALASWFGNNVTCLIVMVAGLSWHSTSRPQVLFAASMLFSGNSPTLAMCMHLWHSCTGTLWWVVLVSTLWAPSGHPSEHMAESQCRVCEECFVCYAVLTSWSSDNIPQTSTRP